MENPFHKTYSPIAIANKLNTSYSYREIIERLDGLIDDHAYDPFFVKQYRARGQAQFFALADRARRSSKTPGKYFVHLLNTES